MIKVTSSATMTAVRSRYDIFSLQKASALQRAGGRPHAGVSGELEVVGAGDVESGGLVA